MKYIFPVLKERYCNFMELILEPVKQTFWIGSKLDYLSAMFAVLL